MKKTVRGQALLIILLVMAVGLTVGLSLSTRSASDLKVSGQTEDSTRAFSAAEAGIEAVLKGDSPGSPVNLGNGSSYVVTTPPLGGSTDALSLGDINISDTYTVWLTSHDSATGDLQVGTVYDYNGNTIDVCWDKADSASDDPAIEVSVLYKDSGGLYKVWRGAYDANAAFRPSGNNYFSGTDSPVLPCTLTYRKNINLLSIVGATGAKIALRLRPFYAKASVSVVPSANLPGQGLSISSVGTSGQTTRKVLVTQSYASLPSIFDYVLFSGKDASKP